MMFKRKMSWLIFLLLLLTVVSCAKNDAPPSDKPDVTKGFQLNDASDSYDDFEIFSIMQDDGTLEEIYNDMDGQGVSDRLATVVNANKDEFINFSENTSDLLKNHSDLVSNLLANRAQGIVAWLIDRDAQQKTKLYDYPVGDSDDIHAFYNPTEASDYMEDFYSFLDTLSDENQAGAKAGMKEMLRVGAKVFQYILDTKNEAEVRDDIQEIIDDLVDPDFEEDFLDISEALGKLLVQADYPIWVDDDGNVMERNQINPDAHTDLELGNGVKGFNILLKWVNRMMADEENRQLLNKVIREAAELFNPDDAEANKIMLKKLVYNIEDLFTEGGDTYMSDPRYNQSDDEIESDSELGRKLKTLFPMIVQTNLRSDRDASIVGDNEWAEKVYPLHQAFQYLKNLKIDTSRIEESFLDMLQYDYLGRDRTDPNSGAWPTPFLDHTIFTISSVLNYGYNDGGNTGEIDPGAADTRKSHGHGENSYGVTLNDSLYSIKTHAIVESGSTSLLSLFDLALHPSDGEFVSRSYNPFKRNEMDQNRFYFDQDYPAHFFMPVACALDSGTPTGGNLGGDSTEMNSYRPYDPTGRGELNTTAWIASGLVRHLMNGEGPYYYADPNANTVTINGKTYYEYLRPNGKVYALVNKDGAEWEYIYPTDVGDAQDEDTDVVTGYLSPADKKKGYRTYKKERFNRFRAQWHSDYHMMKIPLLFGNSYVSPDNSKGDLSTTTISSSEYAKALQYNEIITQDNPRRACASPMEAFVRNNQFYWMEKKIVLVIPLYLSIDLNSLGLGAGSLPLGANFMVVEANGVRGLAEARKFKNNHVWAKKGTKGVSTVPGDYRLEVAAHLVTSTIDFGLIGGITEQLIYDTVLDVGHANPSFVGKNSQTISRLALPRSPVIDRGNGILDYDRGSLEFEVGDDIWANRSAFFPVFMSLVTALYDNTPGYPEFLNPSSGTDIKTGYKMFSELLAPLLTPLLYYQKSEGERPNSCWKPRVYGDSLAGYGDYIGNAYLQSSADMYDKDNPLLSWDGSEEEKMFFMPQPMKTFLGVMVDSDINNINTRMDGLLPTLLSRTKVLSATVDMLLSDVNDTDEFNQALEQILTSVRTTKSEVVKIQEGKERYGESGSGKRFIFPDWMFVKGVESSKDAYGVYQEFTGGRSEDLVFDDIVDTLVGRDEIDAINDGYGLANYPDDKPTLNDADWEDFEDGYDDLVNLIYKDSPYSITESIIKINESFFGCGIIYTDDQIKGLLYGAGKLFTYYDADKHRWVYQGEAGFDDLFRILTESLPALHEELKDELVEVDGVMTYQTNNYWDLLTINTEFLKQDGLLDYVIDSVTVDAKWNQVFSDLDTFLQQDFLTDKDPLWSTTAELIEDMATAMGNNPNPDFDQVYRDYGFQLN